MDFSDIYPGKMTNFVARRPKKEPAAPFIFSQNHLPP